MGQAATGTAPKARESQRRAINFNPGTGTASPTQTLSVVGTVNFTSLDTSGSSTISFLCIDAGGKVFKKATACA
ncbi:MAG: hypothetical protein AABX14_03430 [Candidatus Aenigmatarchaeota archaeon]